MAESSLIGKRVVSKRTGNAGTVERIVEQYGSEALVVGFEPHGVETVMWPYQMTIAGSGQDVEEFLHREKLLHR